MPRRTTGLFGSSLSRLLTGTVCWAGAVVVGDLGAVVAGVLGAVVVVGADWIAAALSPGTSPSAPSDVLVDFGAAVVVVDFGVVVVVGVSTPFTGALLRSWTTGRNRSSAVWPTSSSARSWFWTPGSWTTMSWPCLVMSGSATPRASTRLRMMFSDWSSWPPVAFLVGDSTTDTPPWRSRPSWGLLPTISVRARPP